MFRFDAQLAGVIFDYCRRRLDLHPVPLDLGSSAPMDPAALDGVIGSAPNDPKAVLEVFENELAPAIISADSPRFLSFIPAVPTKASLLFDMIVSCSSLQGTSWLEAAGAVRAENQALSVLASLAGLPSPRVDVSSPVGRSATSRRFSLLAIRVQREDGHRSAAASRSVTRLIRRSARRCTSSAWSLSSCPTTTTAWSARRWSARWPRRATSSVVGVVATAGTTNAGIVDDLAGVAEVARRRNLWFHVDAAYGGAALLRRPRCAGVSTASSMPTRWWWTRTSGCTRRLTALRFSIATPRSPGGCTRSTPSTSRPSTARCDEFNPSDYAFHLTRRARGLPLWFSLAVYGTDAYRDAIETVFATARAAARLIDAAGHLELVREPELSVVMFTPPGWTRPDYDAWSDGSSIARSASSSRAAGRASRSEGCASCTPTPPWRW